MNPQRKDALSQFHREQILNAAQSLFSGGGENVTMDDISRAAAYSKATLYVYFKSKEEIKNAIVLRGMELLSEKLRLALSNADWKAAFFSACGAVAGFCMENPHTYEAVTGSIDIKFDKPGASPVLREIFDKGEEINTLLIDFLRAGMSSHIFREEQFPAQMAFRLWGCVSGLARMAAAKREYLERWLNVSEEEYLRGGFSLLWDSVREK